MAVAFRQRSGGIDLFARLTPKSAIGMPFSNVTSVAGGASRLKTVRVAGDPRQLAEAAERLTGTR